MHSGKGRCSVGLLWHSFRDANLGVGALTLSHLNMVKAAADAANRSLSIRIFGTNGSLWYPPEDMDVEELLITLPTDVLPDTALWRSIADCDVIIDIGNGDVFSDIYGSRAFFWIVCSRIAVLAQRKPLILGPQTIGPFKDASLQSLAAQLVRRCERTFTRDGESVSFLREMGVVEGIQEITDVAFRLPFNSQPRNLGSQIRFGLNVSGLLYQNATSNAYSFGVRVNYPYLIGRIIETIKRQPNISPVLIPHVLGDGTNQHNDDVWICRKLAEEYGIQIAPLFKSPIEAKNYISGLDVLVGSRMHATIAALSSGVPVIPLAYSRKFSGVFSSVSYPVVCDLLTQDEELVLSSINDALHRLPELRDAATKSNAIAQSRLDVYQEYLNQVVLNLA